MCGDDEQNKPYANELFQSHASTQQKFNVSNNINSVFSVNVVSYLISTHTSLCRASASVQKLLGSASGSQGSQGSGSVLVIPGWNKHSLLPVDHPDVHVWLMGKYTVVPGRSLCTHTQRAGVRVHAAAPLCCTVLKMKGCKDKGRCVCERWKQGAVSSSTAVQLGFV